MGFYFLREDGQQVSKEYFLNLLDTCLIHNRWCFGRIVRHSFRIGGMSVARMDGQGILNIRFAGRWSHRSQSIEHYTRMNLVSMPPEQIYQEAPRYIRKWTHQKLAYLATNVIQTASPKVGTHIHDWVLENHFPKFFKMNKHKLPTKYPSLQVSYRLTMRKRDRLNGTYTHKLSDQKIQYQRFIRLRQQLAKLSRVKTDQGKTSRQMQHNLYQGHNHNSRGTRNFQIGSHPDTHPLADLGGCARCTPPHLPGILVFIGGSRGARSARAPHLPGILVFDDILGHIV